MRTTKNGSVSHRGMVTEIDVNRPNRVKTDTFPRYFRRVLKLIHRPSTSMSSIGSPSHSECAISQLELRGVEKNNKKIIIYKINNTHIIIN